MFALRLLAVSAVLVLVSAYPQVFFEKYKCTAPKVGTSYMGAAAEDFPQGKDLMKFYKKGDATKAAVAKFDANGNYVFEVALGDAQAARVFFVHFGGPAVEVTTAPGKDTACGWSTAAGKTFTAELNIKDVAADLVITVGHAQKRGAVQVTTLAAIAKGRDPTPPTAAPTSAPPSIPFPALPKDFSAVIEANIIEKQYTLVVREFYDYDNNRYRVENHRNGSVRVELCDLNSKQHISVSKMPKKPWNCTVSTTATCRGARRSPHLQSASDFLKGTNHTYTYLGEQRERGIDCQYWQASDKIDLSKMPARPGRVRADVIEYDLTWYFAKPGWKNRREDTTTIPVSLHMTGNEKFNNGTILKPFTHYYNFIDFMPTLRDATHYGSNIFNVDEEWGCKVAPAPTAAGAAPTAAGAAPTAASSDVAVKCGAGTENKAGECVCSTKPTTDTSAFKLMESHKTLVAILPAVGLILAVKLFM